MSIMILGEDGTKKKERKKGKGKGGAGEVDEVDGWDTRIIAFAATTFI